MSEHLDDTGEDQERLGDVVPTDAPAMGENLKLL
jgi:hypothetical protein